MWFQRIWMAVIAVVAALWDATVLPWVPVVFFSGQVVLPLVVSLAMFSTLERSLIAAVVGGGLADLLLPSDAGLMSVRYACAALVVSALSRRLFTNRSLWGVCVLAVCAAGIDRACLVGIEWVHRALGSSYIPEARAGFWSECAWIVLVSVLTFLALVAFSRRFLPLISRYAVRKRLDWAP